VVGRMEELLQRVALHVAIAAELLCILCIAFGAVEATYLAVRFLITRPANVQKARRHVWVRFARSIILALEFALAADIARTAVAPSWDDIGQLAAIAFIRTALNFFLERDLEVFGGEEPHEAAARPRV